MWNELYITIFNNNQPNVCEKDTNFFATGLRINTISITHHLTVFWVCIVLTIHVFLLSRSQTYSQGIFTSLTLPRPLSSYNLYLSKHTICFHQTQLEGKCGKKKKKKKIKRRKRSELKPITSATCMESLSASLYTATVLMPIFLAVRMTRQAISPRLAISTLLIWLLVVPDEENLTHDRSDENPHLNQHRQTYKKTHKHTGACVHTHTHTHRYKLTHTHTRTHIYRWIICCHTCCCF